MTVGQGMHSMVVSKGHQDVDANLVTIEYYRKKGYYLVIVMQNIVNVPILFTTTKSASKIF